MTIKALADKAGVSTGPGQPRETEARFFMSHQIFISCSLISVIPY
jgi:hypothetical protein